MDWILLSLTVPWSSLEKISMNNRSCTNVHWVPTVFQIPDIKMNKMRSFLRAPCLKEWLWKLIRAICVVSQSLSLCVTNFLKVRGFLFWHFTKYAHHRHTVTVIPGVDQALQMTKACYSLRQSKETREIPSWKMAEPGLGLLIPILGHSLLSKLKSCVHFM